MSDPNDRLDRLSAETPPEEFSFPVDETPTPIPVRIKTTPQEAVEESLRRAKEQEREGRDVVREYEEKYYGTGEHSRRRQRAEHLMEGFGLGSRMDPAPARRAVRNLSDDERLWAALAHASALVTLGVGIATGGIGALLLIFAPLVIYFAFREKSDFVAYHALQAFAMQIIGTVGWLSLLLVGVIVLGVSIAVSAIASIVLIGIPFLLLFVVLLVVFVPATLVLPFAMLILSILGAVNTYNGHDYRYPYISNWIDRQMSGNSANIVTL